MLENRSFDQMLGFLYSSTGNVATNNQPFEGLTGNESNPDDTGREMKVFKIDENAPHPYLMPGADPGEGFHNTNYQLFRTDTPAEGEIPTNQGFVINFKAAIASDQSKGFKDTLPGTDPAEIMGMYSPSVLPVMSGLAKGFAVCDHWFASAPTQTIPNRAFSAAATSQGHLDNKVKVFTCPSIFGSLSKANIDWAIYGYTRDPMTRLDYSDTQSANESHFGHFRDFTARAAAGTLPAYTFLEPDFGASGNSQHPNYDVSLGEKLIYDVYNAVRSGPGWNDTLLLITYDEHGGNYDHVPPPWGAAPPDDSVGEWGFDFTRFGVRIPALLISPRIAAGTVFRAKQGTIDHTSVLKTIELLWNLDPLTKRDKAAPDLGDVLTLATPRTDDPLWSTSRYRCQPPLTPIRRSHPCLRRFMSQKWRPCRCATTRAATTSTCRPICPPAPRSASISKLALPRGRSISSGSVSDVQSTPRQSRRHQASRPGREWRSSGAGKRPGASGERTLRLITAARATRG